MFAPFSPEENGIRGYPPGYGVRENALKEESRAICCSRGISLLTRREVVYSLTFSSR